MLYINLISIFTVMLMALFFYLFKRNFTCRKIVYNEAIYEKNIQWFGKYDLLVFWGIILIALIIRLVCAAVYYGHPDVTCFIYWGDILHSDGFSGFYGSEGLTDYLPGYLYVLRLLGAVRNIFGLEYGSAFLTIIYKLPAIICDFTIGFIIFKISSKKFDYKNSMIAACMFLLNPLVIINSSLWGQIDSILTLCVIVMCYLIYERKMTFVYIVFGIGFLIKPQMAIFAPVLILALAEELFVRKDDEGNIIVRFNKDEFFKQSTACVLSIAATLFLCIPFGISNVIAQSFDTLGSYEYASVNAYNFWGMLGLDWASQDDYLLFMTYRQWGILFMFIVILICVMVWIANFRERTRYIAMAATLGIGMFTLSVRMHERYIFPAVILLLILFILSNKKNAFWLYVSFSIINFINCAHVLFFYDAYNFDARAAVIVITGTAQCIFFSLFIVYVIKNYIVHNYKFEKNSELLIHNPAKRNVRIDISPSKKDEKFTLKDWALMAGITILYAIVAFYNLGDREVPQTSWEGNNYYETIELEFDGEQYISSMDYFLGNYEERSFSIYYSYDGEIWDYFGDVTMTSVFRWDSFSIGIPVKYIRLELLSEKAVINELVFYDMDNNIVTPVNADDESVRNLFDEQGLAVAESTYRNGTIFDEIYHARTAYEFNNGLYSYEWTHPPLGKIFISWGMKAFGTTPFGWRFAGTLFGIMMLPFMYLMGKKMFNSTFFAAITCAVMACDFMHFTQTRIATIDVFITFFVILMYFFMYWYYKLSFYDTKLYKTFIPLALCGISFGLGCASKWTGVYAGAGLAVIFFYVMYIRFREYKYAKKDPQGVSNGILNSTIINSFIPNFTKTIIFCIVFFVVIPVIIYTLSYIPFVGNDDSPTSLVGRMLYNQKMMFDYHKDCIFEHPYSSRWYEWPLMLRPILYYSGQTADGKLERISSFGNPLIWWFGIAAFIIMIYLVKKYKDRNALFLIIGYIAQLLPWTLVVRTTFIYHYFTSVPFVVLMNIYCFYTLAKKNEKNKIYAVIYLAVVIILFVIFYPALSGKAMSENYDYNILRWLTSWYV